VSNNYNQINHYLAPKFFLYVGRDLTHPVNYNGKIGYMALNLGDGAFRDGKDFGHKDDSR
jgi:trans-2-enoyl-CoA reductase